MSLNVFVKELVYSDIHNDQKRDERSNLQNKEVLTEQCLEKNYKKKFHVRICIKLAIDKLCQNYLKHGDMTTSGGYILRIPYT